MIRWGTKTEIERRRRIRLSIWAYAYEYENVSLVSDDEFDRESRLVDLSIDTGRLDLFFRENFSTDTGMWIRAHPELDKVKNCYERYYKH